MNTWNQASSSDMLPHKNGLTKTFKFWCRGDKYLDLGGKRLLITDQRGQRSVITLQAHTKAKEAFSACRDPLKMNNNFAGLEVLHRILTSGFFMLKLDLVISGELYSEQYTAFQMASADQSYAIHLNSVDNTTGTVGKIDTSLYCNLIADL